MKEENMAQFYAQEDVSCMKPIPQDDISIKEIMMDSEVTVENTYIETNTDYKQGVALSEYNGVYSLASVNESTQGGKFLQWIYPKLKDGAAKKEIPWQCKLGNAKQARQILQQYADLLKEIDDGAISDTPF